MLSRFADGSPRSSGQEPGTLPRVPRGCSRPFSSDPWCSTGTKRVSLEDEFWNGLKKIATARKITLPELIASIDRTRCQGNLSSALRLFILEFYPHQAERCGSELAAA
jgi:Ribbon-helix-helix domain